MAVISRREHAIVGIHEIYDQETALSANNTESGAKQHNIGNVSRLICAKMKQVKPTVR